MLQGISNKQIVPSISIIWLELAWDWKKYKLCQVS